MQGDAKDEGWGPCNHSFGAEDDTGNEGDADEAQAPGPPPSAGRGGRGRGKGWAVDECVNCAKAGVQASLDEANGTDQRRDTVKDSCLALYKAFCKGGRA